MSTSKKDRQFHPGRYFRHRRLPLFTRESDSFPLPPGTAGVR